MKKRGYKYNLENRNNYFSVPKIYFDKELPKYEDIFKLKMNDRYLKQCLYNLQEKFDANGITTEEWQKIIDKVGDLI